MKRQRKVKPRRTGERPQYYNGSGGGSGGSGGGSGGSGGGGRSR